MNRHGAASAGLSYRQRRVRERDEHLDGAASIVEAEPTEVGQTALGEVVVHRPNTWRRLYSPVS